MSKGTQNWSILKTFLNSKKVPIIPPLFHKNEFVTYFKNKAELFNSFLLNNVPYKVTTVNYPLRTTVLTRHILIEAKPKPITILTLNR